MSPRERPPRRGVPGRNIPAGATVGGPSDRRYRVGVTAGLEPEEELLEPLLAVLPPLLGVLPPLPVGSASWSGVGSGTTLGGVVVAATDDGVVTVGVGLTATVGVGVALGVACSDGATTATDGPLGALLEARLLDRGATA
jgi:hypothetical protein